MKKWNHLLLAGLLVVSAQLGQAASAAPATHAPSQEYSIWRNTLDYWDRYFQDTVHPFLIRTYRSYYLNYGSDVSAFMLNLYEFWSPRMEQVATTTKGYWYHRNPRFWDDLALLPAPLKKGYEKFTLFSWKVVANNRSKAPDLRADVNKALDTSTALVKALDAMLNAKTGPKWARGTRLLNELRPFARDPKMGACYEIVIVDQPIINAFNTGCHIFLTTATVDLLDDKQLRAAIAHEMSHGDQGHSLKSLLSISAESGKHFSILILDDLDWLLTGHASERLSRVGSEGNLPVILDAFGDKAPEIEISADRGGVGILERAGHSREDLIAALSRMTEALRKAQPPGAAKGKSTRKYPSLERRTTEIRNLR